MAQEYDISKLKFCNGSGYPTFLDYTRRRDFCSKICRRDCEEENYNLVMESAYSPDYDSKKPLVIIRPDRKLQEVVTHSSDMDPYQLIGYLGGHAHLWLGLSAIQLYDVFYKIIVYVKHVWIRFVEW